MTLYSAFQPKTVVKNPDHLFGHHKPRGLLERVCTQCRMGTNTQVLGERSSGKSSLLACVQVKLRKQAAQLLSVFVPFNDGLKSPADAYRYFLALIHEELCLMPEAVTVASSGFATHGITLTCGVSVVQKLEELRRLDDEESHGAFEDFFHFLNKHNLGVVLMIDEYEYYLKRTFDGDPMRFWALRQLATQASSGNAPKLLTVVLAGATDWGKLCEGRVPAGSPVQGMMTHRMYVEPIGPEDFEKMWGHCMKESATEVQERIGSVMPDVARIFDLTGGWPFLGKVIGQHLVTASEVDEQELVGQLRDHFDVIWKERTDKERDQLLAILGGRDPGTINELKNRGLVEVDNQNRVRLRGELWSLYLNQQHSSMHSSSIQTEAAGSDVALSEHVFRKSGEYYEIRFGAEEGSFKGKGFDILCQLLRTPHETIPVLQLQGWSHRPDTKLPQEDIKEHELSTDTSFQERIDEETLAAVRNRLKDLEEEIPLRREVGEIEKLEDLEEEKKKLDRYLRESTHNPKAVCAGRKARRKQISRSELHKVGESVRKNLDHAYEKLKESKPPLTKLVEHFKDMIEKHSDGLAYCPPEQFPKWQLD